MLHLATEAFSPVVGSLEFTGAKRSVLAGHNETFPRPEELCAGGAHWWPGPFGRSWLVDSLHLGRGWAIVVGLVWLGAGLLLVLGALGLLGVPPLRDSSPIILLAGASLALAALTASFHPIYLVAVLVNIASSSA